MQDFSTIDLDAGFRQTLTKDSGMEKNAFSIYNGNFAFFRMTSS